MQPFRAYYDISILVKQNLIIYMFCTVMGGGGGVTWHSTCGAGIVAHGAVQDNTTNDLSTDCVLGNVSKTPYKIHIF